MGGDKVARGLLFLTNHPALMVATTLVGNSLANYLVSLAAVVIFQTVATGEAQWVEWITPLLLAPILLVYGELLPKNLFLQAPNRLLRRCGPLLLASVVLLLPLSAWLWGLSRLLARWMHAPSDPIRLVLARRTAPRAGRRARGGHPAPRPTQPGPGHFRRGRPTGRAIPRGRRRATTCHGQYEQERGLGDDAAAAGAIGPHRGRR